METEAGGSWVEAIGDLHRERIDMGRERETERRVKKSLHWTRHAWLSGS